jgi:hypothetical protein
MEKFLSVLPFDRFYKFMTFLGLILAILPPSYFATEMRKYQQENIQLDGKNDILSQKEKNLENSLKVNRGIIKEVLKRDFTYEETKERTSDLFDENKSYIKDLDQIEIERTNLKTELRVLENNNSFIMERRWGLGGIAMIGLILTVVGALNWSIVEENELRLAYSLSKSQRKS